MDRNGWWGLNVFNADTNKFRHIPSTYGEKVASITGVDKNHLLISLFGKGYFSIISRLNIVLLWLL